VTTTVTVTETVVATQQPGSGASLPGGLTAFPNPARDRMTFIVDLETAGEVEVAIYNLDSELVARLHDTLPAGRGRTLAWDCRSAASGVYLARFKVQDGEMRTVRIAVTH